MTTENNHIVIQSIDELQDIELSYPVTTHPSFTFQNQGVGIAYDKLALIGLVKAGLDASPSCEVLLIPFATPPEHDSMIDHEELATWALLGGICWIGSIIRRGPAKYVAIIQRDPYKSKSPEILEGTEGRDIWECLRKARVILNNGIVK